jgi:GTP pyrophosphokinase
MVKVRDDYPLQADGRVDIDRWVANLPVDISIDRKLLSKACEASFTAEKTHQDDKNTKGRWADGPGSFLTGLEMAQILADLHLDQESLLAAILYRAVREEKLSLVSVKKQFGENIAKLIEGVLRMAAVSRVRIEPSGSVLGQREAQNDTVRKMLVALVDDVRVALIKLAERTCAIRAVKNTPEKRYKVAREVFDIYAPLAHRLGIGHIKWELEDLSFRYIEPDAYKKIAKLLDGKRLDRQRYIDDVKTQLHMALLNAGIHGELSGRAKHIYSIWRKMQRKGIGFSQVYDIRAVRLLVNEVKDCYAALGIVHGLWRNIPNEFDDYIANPKENGYRSLHTAVIGPDGKVLEVQIRTHAMHEESELGVCSHWRYKGTDKEAKNTSSYEEKIAWLRQVLDWHEETGDIGEVAEQFSQVQDRVYVFTPEGHVVNLSNNSTPLDFAYHVHTSIGHRCRGAKVNGRIVPLNYCLQTGEQVEILTGKEESPRRDWLQAGSGFLNSPRSRAKVQHWFRLQAREDNIAAGRNLLEREFKRLALTSLDYKSVAEKVKSRSVDDMYAAVGAGDLSALQVVHAAQALVQKADPIPNFLSPQQLAKQQLVKQQNKSAASDDKGITIQGVGNLLTHFPRCCKPLPGDAIVGYITVGRGVSIHHQDCARLLQLQHKDPSRIVAVSWGVDTHSTYPAEIIVEAYDRQGLLRDVANVLAIDRVNVLAMNTLSDTHTATAVMRITVEVAGLDTLSYLLTRLNSLPNVISANRIGELKK